jgi:hypothetical protein
MNRCAYSTLPGSHSLYSKNKTTYARRPPAAATAYLSTNSQALLIWSHAASADTLWIILISVLVISTVNYLKYTSVSHHDPVGEQHAAWLQSGDIASDLQQHRGERDAG